MGISFNEAQSIKNLPYDLVDQEWRRLYLKQQWVSSLQLRFQRKFSQASRKRAEDALGDELKGAVITVPAYFNDAQRQSTKGCC